MCQSLKKNCGSFYSFSVPSGGWFVWLKLQGDFFPSSGEFVEHALRLFNLQVTPGTRCVADPLDLRRIGATHVRLCYSYNTFEAIEAATVRLAKLAAYFKEGRQGGVTYRELTCADASLLLRFFNDLSPEARSNFKPHNATSVEQLAELIEATADSATRLGAFCSGSIVRAAPAATIPKYQRYLFSFRLATSSCRCRSRSGSLIAASCLSILPTVVGSHPRCWAST